MKVRKKYKLIFLPLLSLLIISGVFAYAHKYVSAPKTEQKASADSITSETAPEQPSQIIPEADGVIVENLTMPILMFHHIRDFSDQSDPIGVNLSVSPAKFASELDLIQRKGFTTITFRDLENGNIPDKPIILTFDDGYQNFYDNAYPEIKRRQMKAVAFIITGMNGGDYMNNAEIKEISDYGIEIGSHTISHPDLSTISNEKAIREVTESKEILEKITGKPVISLCYPSGKFNDPVVADVKNAGYKYATTTKNALSDFKNTLEISRYRVNSDANIESYLK